MNTRSIGGAAKVICSRLGRPNAVGATIAVALDASGWLHTTETAAELVRLRLLQDAQPASLTPEQLQALDEAGSRAANDAAHEAQCACSTWPAACSSGYYATQWDCDITAALPAVIGRWEAMRARVELAELARLRDRVAELEAKAAGGTA
ncbi:hypothetical protein ACFWCB_26195 [Streptomyces sp. NPDC060048]|uniref:hypothetical protein n=1 Tax=unclassified Streptomyces TaxID=2593676 RepID=UPI003697BAA9